MRRSIVAAIVATLALGLLTFVAPLIVNAQGGECPEGTARYTLHENDSWIGDTTGPWCSDLANLANVPHVPPGGCAKAIGESSTWNDCVSRISVWSMRTDRCIEIWTDANFSGNRPWRIYGLGYGQSMTYSLSGFWNDTYSSIDFNVPC